MTIALLILGLLLIILNVGRICLSIKFSRQVMDLFAQSKSISDQKFHRSQLDSLPEPVQRYFNHILKEGQPYISYARIKHDGQFKAELDKDWIDIMENNTQQRRNRALFGKAQHRCSWHEICIFQTRVDLLLYFFQCLRWRMEEVPNMMKVELLRWLGESILYPTNLLPNKRLQWSPIDSSTAELTFNYDGLSLFFKMTFNAVGEITEMETKRYMG